MIKLKEVTIFTSEKNEIKIPRGCQTMIYDLAGNDFCRCGFVGISTGVLDNPEQESVYLCNKCIREFSQEKKDDKN